MRISGTISLEYKGQKEWEFVEVLDLELATVRLEMLQLFRNGPTTGSTMPDAQHLLEASEAV